MDLDLFSGFENSGNIENNDIIEDVVEDAEDSQHNKRVRLNEEVEESVDLGRFQC